LTEGRAAVNLSLSHPQEKQIPQEDLMAEETKKQAEQEPKKETGKSRTEDVESFIKDFWGKVVEYASLGAEEASKVSTTAKMRVDIETLKFKRGKLAKLLGERYFDEWLKDSSVAVKGMTDTLRQIKKVDAEVRKLEKEIDKARSKAKPKPKSTKKKTTAKTKPAAKKTTTGKKTPTTAKKGESK
jgi:hypothetical protein